MIELRGIKKIYKMGTNEVQALKGVSLKIDKGDFVAIMGPSGSGKSTLTQILGLLDVPSEGSYLLNGREIAHLSEDELATLRREEIGFIFQQFNLLPRMSATDNVALPLLYSEGKITHERAQELLDQVGLGSRSFHRPNELSGGQQQRVAIARALVNKPKIIFADEPTGNLDSTSEREIMALLRELNAQGITVIMVTHEDEIGSQANRVIRMRDGVVQSDERRTPLPQTEANLSGHVMPPASLTMAEIWEHFVQGFRTLAANKVRTVLSMLGILIGVAAVVAMLALGRGAQKAIESELSSLGSNLLILKPGAVRVGGVAQEAGATTRLTVDDAMVLKERIPQLNEAAASLSGRVQIAYLNKNWNSVLQGAQPSYARIHSANPEMGRFFTEDENGKRARVAVLGATVVRELFGDRNPIGEMVKINKISFLVIGVLPEKGASGFRDNDDVVVIPVLTAMYRVLGKTYVDSIELEVGDAANIPMVESSALSIMFSRKRVPLSQQNDAFQIFNMADLQAALSQSSQTMSLLLASIAAISLIVGGIGIMNIMLVSVTERTKEIGLRKAIGARRKDILLQFLAEAVVVSVVGGLIGIILGWASTVFLSSVAGWATSVSMQSVFLAFFFSASIGVVFGIYPARKASRLSPIEALRHD